jgi:protein-disulfide isomerase
MFLIPRLQGSPVKRTLSAPVRKTRILAASLALSGLLALAAGLAPHARADAIAPALLQQLRSDPHSPVAGNPHGAVTVVEFFDYRCPYCRMMQPKLQALLASDKRVRLVLKEWPIFGGVSIYAAEVALAADRQGKYLAVHDALFTLPRQMDRAGILSAAKQAGVDMTRLSHDLAAHKSEIDGILAADNAQARALSLQGTPGFVIGRTVVPGALSGADLAQLVASAAKPGG